MNIKSELHIFTNAIKLCKLLIDAGGEARFIGGCVRDILINKAPTDIDLATNLNPEIVQDILEKNKIKYFSIGKEFGTIAALLNKQQIEITTLRKDLSSDGRYSVVEFTDDWKEDAQRRDFTINALSADIEGNVYDYFAGIDDLKQRAVKFIGNPEERIQEDYLRILRFFRFSAHLSDSIDEEGLKASRKYANCLKNISGYRIRSEMSKIFLSPNSIKILKIMEQEKILQEIFPCDDDSIEYLANLHNIANEFNSKIDELLCLALFFRNGSEHSHEFPLSRAEKILFNKLISVKITNWDYPSLRKYWQIYKESFKSIVLLNLAEISGLKCKEDLNRLFNTDIQKLPVAGKDLLKLDIKPGKKMGQLLGIAENIWYENELKLTKQELIKELLPYAHKF